MKKIFVAVFVLLFSASAFASDFRFSYEANEFSTAEKFAAFHTRLEKAARDYCVTRHMEQGNSAEARLHAHHQHFEKSCLTDLVTEVVEKIGHKGLVAYTTELNSRQG